jgi:hypothetical protein
MYLTAVTVWAASSILLPPVWEWQHGITFLSKPWWGALILDVLTMALFPVVVIVCTLIAVSGSALGAFYEAIESP